MHKARRSVLPKLSTNHGEVYHALKTYPFKTNRDEHLLLVDDEENNIIIFSCETNLEFLCTFKSIYVDGTFNCSAQFFLQMFTIHRLAVVYYISLLFFLLPSKQKTSYTLAFNYGLKYVRPHNSMKK